MLTMGVMGHSDKENERRIAIHPEHLPLIPEVYRQQMMFESGYGADFGLTDDDLRRLTGGVGSEAELVARCDVILQPKPTVEEVARFRAGQVLWGWPHLVQGPELTQVAIDNKLTAIAFENMNVEDTSLSLPRHVFERNNEIAGFASVAHALTLRGLTGHFGRPLTAAVIGYGATGKGAVRALRADGAARVVVLTRRAPASVPNEGDGAELVQLRYDFDANQARVEADGGLIPLPEFLSTFDVIVNCTLQDPLKPMMFLMEDQIDGLAPGALVVDVSCDDGMGFSWAKSTTFDSPILDLAGDRRYYAVDHSPSLLWDSATWEISEALIPFIPVILAGREAWLADPVVRDAVEIIDGKIRNRKILEFQKRSQTYPYPETKN